MIWLYLLGVAVSIVLLWWFFIHDNFDTLSDITLTQDPSFRQFEKLLTIGAWGLAIAVSLLSWVSAILVVIYLFKNTDKPGGNNSTEYM